MTILLAAQPPLFTETETRSTHILGPVFFELCNLRIEASTAPAIPPSVIAPSNSPYIVASDEALSVSVDVHFNSTPLTRLLLCLGMKVEIQFAFEGVGGRASETDVSEYVVTVKDDFDYTITWTGTPASLELTQGLYAIAAIANVSAHQHPCSQEVLGYGYMAARLLQVYPA